MSEPSELPELSDSAADPSLTRREALRRLACGAVVLGGGAFASLRALPQLSGGLVASARADAVIHIFLSGGLSHLDSFDPKPNAPVEVRGPYGSVATKTPGLRFGSQMRRTAGITDQLAVLRTMAHSEAAHERGRHSMLTGYGPSPALVYPSFGSVVAHELGGRADLPPYVSIGAGTGEMGTGYLSAAHGAFAVGGRPERSDFRVRDLAPSKAVSEERITRRRSLRGILDGNYEAGASDSVRALEAFYEQAWDLIGNAKARTAFDLRKEPRKLRESYGMSTIGQRMLLARRLVGAGVRYVTVTDGGYDMHNDIRNGLRRRLPALDRGFAALIRDLAERGQLDRTLVVLSTEFGRTPRENRTRGRDHWPRCFSSVLAGGGVKGGIVRGHSDDTGSEPDDLATSPADLAATLFHLSGIDPTRRLLSPGARPIDIVRDGSVLKELLV